MDLLNDLLNDDKLTNISRQVMKSEWCVKLAPFAKRSPHNFAVQMHKHLRNSTRDEYNKIEDTNPIGTYFRALNDTVVEKISEKTALNGRHPERIWCLARATSMGAVLLNTDIKFWFTGYHQNQRIVPAYWGHCWLLVNHNDKWQDIDPFQESGKPPPMALERRKKGGFNRPDEWDQRREAFIQGFIQEFLG